MDKGPQLETPSVRGRLFHFIKNWVSLAGDPRKILSLRHFGRYVADWLKYRNLPHAEKFYFKDSFPCLSDWTPYTPFDPHYFYQSVWLSRKLRDATPSFHVDIGSSITMLAVSSAYAPTLFIDYRPLKVHVDNLVPVAGNSLALPFSDDQLMSLSSLHVIEHIGLGRYGDPLNPQGTRLAAKELVRILTPGGKLYISVPVGRERTQFNAQRIFSPKTITDMFASLKLISFALIDDEGRLVQPAEFAMTEGCEYGCGLFEMTK